MKDKVLKGIGFCVIYLALNVLTAAGYMYQNYWFWPILVAPAQIIVFLALLRYFYS